MQIRISAKCSDLFSMSDKNGRNYNGYVPDFLGSYSDYVELEIDLETGQLLNWEAPSQEEVDAYFEGDLD